MRELRGEGERVVSSHMIESPLFIIHWGISQVSLYFR